MYLFTVLHILCSFLVFVVCFYGERNMHCKVTWTVVIFTKCKPFNCSYKPVFAY